MDSCFSQDYADAWLHAHGDPFSADAKPIKATIRAAFHSDEPMWPLCDCQFEEFNNVIDLQAAAGGLSRCAAHAAH